LTYRELNTRANRLAHYLIELGVRPEQVVGMCLERSLNMVVGLLGILKAGGAYVPLDPAYPNDRIAFMLEDSQAQVLVTQQNIAGRMVSRPAKTVCLDADWPQILTNPDRNLSRRAAPHNLAYVIYTSGSTGTPKGVAIEHRSTVTFIKWAQSVFTADELSGVLASTSICFDLSVFELFVTLSLGGRVILVENALGLPSLRTETNVKLINTVPSAIHELLRMKAVPRSVMTVNLAGEPLSTDLVNAIYRQTRASKVYDLYGPTEDTTYSTYTLRSPGVIATIGRPIADTQAYVLDQRRQFVPVGVPGELYLGGAGLARGYLNRPELTAEKFVANPLEDAPSPRLYRTGDLVRWREEGQLEYLGRIDHQVKIRGFRIELGEIESRLRCHPALEQAVVAAREDSPGNKRLVAYLVTTEQKPPDIEELRSHLEQTLPGYMIPSAFVTLNALPLTPNGKVDRKALPAPETLGQAPAGDYVAPRTPLQQQLAQIWSSVLKVERVGLRDNFFVLGGDSLMAAEAMLRVRNISGFDLPLRSLFEASTIADLAAAIERDADRPTDSEGDVTSATRLDHDRHSTGDDNGRLSGDLTEKLESIWIRGNALAPSDFCEIVRSGDDGVPIVCVGDARPIPFLLGRLSHGIPILQLKFDGVHVWPPYYLSAATQTDVYAHALEKLCVEKRVAILGWSYGGTLAYQLGLALQDRGWSRIGVFMIEPDTPMRLLPFGRYQLLKRQLRQALTDLYRGARPRRHEQDPQSLPEIRELGDRYARWDFMVGHYQNNIHSVRPRPFEHPMTLVGCESYQARFADAWRGVARVGFEQCLFTHTDDHAACFLDARCMDQWLTCLELWYAGIWGPETARTSPGSRSLA
jgi:amino acid adenylation domain-containing protein